MAFDALYGIRATRAAPPGSAVNDGERRAVYGSALAQFDELIEAAATAGPASRPLPLFYALSQAGRAIAAAHAEGIWQLRTHGLTAPDLDAAPPSIKVHRSQAAANDGAWVDSFTGVAAATNADIFASAASLGALWASLPELVDLHPPALASAPGPLRLVPEDPGPENLHLQTDPGHVYASVVGFPGSAEELATYLAARYPTSGNPRLFQPQGLPHVQQHTVCGFGVLFRWQAESPDIDGHARTLERIAPEDGVGVPADGAWLVFPPSDGFQPRWLRPSVGGAALSSLLSWWALLFGLSMLARYEPAVWTGALDYHSSDLAAPLAELLERGLTRVPELVLAALAAAPAEAIT
jgi:YaaC-like Protein